MATVPAFKPGSPQSSDQIYQVKKISEDGVVLSNPTGSTQQVSLDHILLNGQPAPTTAIHFGSQVKQVQGQWILLPPSLGPVQKPAISKGPPVMVPHDQKPGQMSFKQGPPVVAFQPVISPAPGVRPLQAPVAPQPMAKIGVVSSGKTGTVFKVDLQKGEVMLKVDGKLESVPISGFEDRSSLQPGNTVKQSSSGQWVLVASGPPGPSPRPVVPALPQPVSIPSNTQATIKTISLDKVTLLCDAPDNSSIEVPIGEIRTAQGQNVTARQLATKMRVLKGNESLWLLIAPLPEQLQAAPKPVFPSNYLPIEAVDDIYPGDRAFMTEIKEFLIGKYAGLYWSRGGSYCRSIAAFVFQCLLLEAKTGQMPIADSLHVRDSMGRYTNTALSIKHPDYERTYAGEIDYIEKGIAGLVGNSESFDFTPLANTLQIAITVVTRSRQEPFYECVKLFPVTEPYDKDCQHMVLLGKPPYPVLITKKLTSLLGTTMEISTPVHEFIYTKQKKEPPKIDPTLTEKVTQIKKLLTGMESINKRLLDFVVRLLSRLEQMMREGQVGADMCSSEVAAQLTALWQLLRTDSVARNAEVSGVLGTILGNVWGQFTVKCDLCAGQYRDGVLECGHSVCSSCMHRIISAAQSQGRVLSPTEDSTALQCPICMQPISKAALKAYNKDLYDRLVAEVDQSTGLRECTQCETKRPQSIVWEQPCKHTCCVICANNQITFCRYCSVDMSNVPSAMSTWELQCQACGTNFMASGLLPALCPSLHIVCPTCMLYAAKTSVCVVANCQRPFAHSDLTTLKAKCMGTCSHCQSIKLFSELVESQCSCVICLVCAGNFVRTSMSYSSCWLCSTGFSQELSNSLYEKLELGKEAVCFYCGMIFCDITLSCGEKIHMNCLFTYATQQTRQSPMLRVDCGVCGIEVYAEFLFQYVSRELLPELSAANPDAVEARCPKCPNTVLVSANLFDISQIQCDRCSFIFCSLCMEWDPDHDDNRCKVALAARNIVEWEGKKIQCVQCPYCKCGAARALGQVSQSCEFCQQQFCPECAVRLDPVTAHGESYHRMECSLHSQQLDATFKEKCTLCNILGEPNGGENGDEGCKPPGRLARRGRFPPGFSY